MTKTELKNLIDVINSAYNESYTIDDVGSVMYYDGYYYAFMPVEATFKVDESYKNVIYKDTFDILMDSSEYGKPIIELGKDVYVRE